MVSHTSSTNTFTSETNKGLGTVETSFFFYANDKHAIAYIDSDIIAKLQLSRRDKATQEIVTTPQGLGILILPKRSKNRTTGSGYHTNPADDSADSLPNYQNHVQIPTS
jgi:hypothetical protein